jgi:hypothetical protein
MEAIVETTYKLVEVKTMLHKHFTVLERDMPGQNAETVYRINGYDGRLGTPKPHNCTWITAWPASHQPHVLFMGLVFQVTKRCILIDKLHEGGT